jgi:flagellar hook-basal body complex protein FliE
MNDIRISNGTGLPFADAKTQTQTKNSSTSAFSDTLRNAINDVNKFQQDANQTLINFQTGNSGSLHETMIALEKADISFRTMLQVRNKLLEAYQEIMRIQV